MKNFSEESSYDLTLKRLQGEMNDANLKAAEAKKKLDAVPEGDPRRKSLENAYVTALRKVEDLSQKSDQAQIQAKTIAKRKEELGIGDRTLDAAASSGSQFFKASQNDPVSRLAGAAGGVGLELARRATTSAVATGAALAKRSVPALKSGIATAGAAAKQAVPAAKSAAATTGAAVKQATAAVKSKIAGAAAAAKRSVPVMKSGIATFGAAAKHGASQFMQGARKIFSDYDYSELVRSLSRLDEQQYQQLLQQIDADQIELVESAMQVVNMGPGYNRLRTRLVYKFDEAVATPQTQDDAEERLQPTIDQLKHLRPWNQKKPVGPFGPKGPKGKRITLRSHRTGTTPKGRPVPTVESAPVNAVGAGENIAGINPPAGPALLGSSKLKGVAAGATAKQIAKRHGVPLASIIKQLEMGAKVEREHTQDAATAKKIAMDHVFEDPKYYSKLARMEGGKTTKQENYDIGNNTRFTTGDRFKKFRITMMQTRRQTNAHPGNPGVEHA